MISNLIPSLVALFLLLINRVVADPRAQEAALICTNTTASFQERQIFISNFLATMDLLTPMIASRGFAAVVNGTGNNTVYSFGECMRDLSRTDCNLCFAQCKTQILRCLPFQKGTRGGRLYYDGCYLRYDDHDFFNQSLSSQDETVCAKGDFGGNLTVWRANVVELVRNLSFRAPKNDGFAVGFVNRRNVSVYGLAQCWEPLNGSGCEECLGDAVEEIGSCSSRIEGRVLNAGCYLRFSPNKFYDNSTSDSGSGNARSRPLAIILSVISVVIAVLIAIAAVLFFARRKVLKNRREKKLLGALLLTVNKSKLSFSYEALERATDYFHSSNKLGQGGSGSVYKGVLSDGRAVAIKRLFFNTTQWVDHFFNEVNLISEIDHKNLVKLLGCSITGPESLLVYEYVPNHSLNDYFCEAWKNEPLSWDLRYKIILGTAEGLAYLHEESKLRIIHRDIKLSNILLDSDFSPKIADFGLARLFPEDKTHISTAIAGTLGYMAPEYIVQGKLTEKADVYSFGVVVIEVVSGRRNNSFSQSSTSILQMVWNLYGTGRLPETVDPALKGNYQIEEASRLLQIGLLCAQASSELRPSMSVVVKMLMGNHEIPHPTQPPFINSNSAEISPRTPGLICNSQSNSNTQSSENRITESWIEPR